MENCNRKLLFISPTPTHRTNAGNRARILSFVELLRSEGYEVYFLLLEYESSDKIAMHEYWGDKITYYTREQLYHTSSVKRRAKNKLVRIKGKLKKWIGHKSGKYSLNDIRYNGFVDENYPDDLKKVVLQLHEKHNFFCVWVEYVMLSKAFTYFNDKVLRVLDTHDVFTDRYKRYLAVNHNPEWFSFFEEEEAKGYNRADIVIAIQPQEVDFIKGICASKVLQIGHLVQHRSASVTNYSRSLLFVASDHRFNVDGINYFLTSVYPTVVANVPGVKLLIAGSIARVKDQLALMEQVDILGEFDTLEGIYDKGDIVICPVRSGTGLKIKLIEALAHGKPCVATLTAIEGLEEYAGKYFVAASTDKEFADQLIDILNSEDKRVSLSKNSHEFCLLYNRRSEIAALLQLMRQYSN